MRRNGIDSASEVHVVREVDLISHFEALSHGKAKLEGTPQRMKLGVPTILLQQLQLLFEAGFCDVLRSHGLVVEPLRNLGFASTRCPNELNHVKNPGIDPPRHLA